ncbi:MAG: hypothetical protein WD845_13070 [Pirellulales bacterium]
MLQGLFLAWVHRNLEGESHRAFLPGVELGLTEAEAAAGLESVCKVGFDGQQYYRVANDIFARRDTPQHMSGPIYRYQRVGVPLVAGALASVFGFELTPPLLYHTVQFGLTAAGFGALVYWLVLKGLHPAYALGWLVSGGTLSALWIGVADAPGDALFVFAILALLARRLWVYVPIATLLLLTREGYAVFAFAVFAVTVLSRIAWRANNGVWRPLPLFSWRDASGYWRPVVLTALPGIIMLSWTIYLQVQLNASALEARNDPGMQSWPFLMISKAIGDFYRDRNWFQLRLLLVSGFTIVAVLYVMIRHWRSLPLALACTIPYLLLVSSLGRYTWEDSICFLRVIGASIIIGLFLLPIDKSLVLRFMLALQAAAGIDGFFNARIMHPRTLSTHLIHEESGYAPNPPGAPDNPLLNDLRSTVEWVDPQPVVPLEYRGIWMPTQREVRPITVAVTNRSDITWQPGLGKHPIWLGYILSNSAGDRQLATHSIIIDKPISPGETKEFTIPLELWRANRGYTVEFSLRQDGPGWFMHTDPRFGHKYQFRVE